MSVIKTKTIENLEQKMENVAKGTLRYQILENAKSFKTSWVDLGQALHTVWKDKMYRDWGYGTFDAYAIKEIGIRKQTALKLLRSYYFLEKEEPRYLNKGYHEGVSAASLPTYESVDALRLASKKKDIDKEEYETIKQNVLQKGKDAKDVKKDLTALIKQREELQPEEAWKKKKQAILKRFLSALKSISRELKISKMLPAQIVKDVDNLIREIESEL
ncbi:MAG: hypothetical protein ABID09_07765 [Candidatus Omnitrophota bacterium]